MHDQTTLAERPTAIISWEAVSSLADFAFDGWSDGTSPPMAWAWDMQRLLDDDGFSIYAELMIEFEPPAKLVFDGHAGADDGPIKAITQTEYAELLQREWNVLKHRARLPGLDDDLVDVMLRARAAGWTPPDDTVLPEPPAPIEPDAADVAEYQANLADFVEELRQERIALFPTAQRLATQHPQWRADFERQALLAGYGPEQFTDFFALLTFEGTPTFEQADDLLGFVEMYLDQDDFTNEHMQMNIDVKLRAQQLESRVLRSLFSFTDFQRNEKNGLPDPTNPDNVRIFLRMKQISLRFNDWHQRIEVQETSAGAWQPLTDAIVNRLITEAGDSQHQFRPAEALFRRTVATIAHEAAFDPLVAEISQRESAWDGVPRLDKWLSRAMGVADDAYHRAVGRNVIGNMVRRAREPGCKADEVMLLSSSTQGLGKSTACEILALKNEYFTDSVMFDGSQQNVVPQLFGKWVIELSELSNMARKDVDHIKQFISTKNDHFTPKYSALAKDNPRRCIFIGTTNSSKPLSDETGNRRWLPVHVTQQIDLQWLRQNVDQIVGEAAALHTAGASFAIPEELWGVASQRQESARSVSSEEELLIKWFDRTTITGNGLWVAATDIGHALKMSGYSANARYGEAMKRLGYRDENIMVHELGRRSRVWVRSGGVGIDGCIRLVPMQDRPGGQVDMRMQPAINALPPAPPAPVPPFPVA